MAETKVSVTHLTPTQLGHILVLKEDNGERVLVIKLSHQDYTFVELALEGRNTAYGTPHDTMKNMLVALGGTADRVVIGEPEIRDLNNPACVATIYIQKNGQSISIGSRPSDAIALALETHCPIFVEDGTFEGAVDYPTEPAKLKGVSMSVGWLGNLDQNSLISH